MTSLATYCRSTPVQPGTGAESEQLASGTGHLGPHLVDSTSLHELYRHSLISFDILCQDNKTKGACIEVFQTHILGVALRKAGVNSDCKI